MRGRVARLIVVVVRAPTGCAVFCRTRPQRGQQPRRAGIRRHVDTGMVLIQLWPRRTWQAQALVQEQALAIVGKSDQLPTEPGTSSREQHSLIGWMSGRVGIAWRGAQLANSRHRCIPSPASTLASPWFGHEMATALPCFGNEFAMRLATHLRNAEENLVPVGKHARSRRLHA